MFAPSKETRRSDVSHTLAKASMMEGSLGYWHCFSLASRYKKDTREWREGKGGDEIRSDVRSSVPEEFLVCDRVAVIHPTSVCISVNVFASQNASVRSW